MTRKLFSQNNHHSTRGYDFQLYTIDLEGKNLKQITYKVNLMRSRCFLKTGKISFQQIEISRNQEKPMFSSQLGRYRQAENVNETQLKIILLILLVTNYKADWQK